MAAMWQRLGDAAGTKQVGVNRIRVEAGQLPPNVVHLDQVDLDEDGDRMIAEAAGSEATGLKLATRGPDEELAIPHCHSLEEEAFIVLEGGGTLELWPSPRAVAHGAQ